jgi:hypothetical protein
MPYRKFKANAGLAWQPMLTSNGIKLNRVGRAMVDSELFEKGLETRRQVLGAKYVDANPAGSDGFMMTFQCAVKRAPLTQLGHHQPPGKSCSKPVSAL